MLNFVNLIKYLDLYEMFMEILRSSLEYNFIFIKLTSSFIPQIKFNTPKIDYGSIITKHTLKG